MSSSVGAIYKQGFGCMGLSAFYSSSATTSEAQALAVFKAAYDAGVTLFNTATFYGPLVRRQPAARPLHRSAPR